MSIMEGQGVGGHVGDESSPSLCFFFFHDGAISVFFQGQSDATCLPIFQFFQKKRVGFKWCRCASRALL